MKKILLIAVTLLTFITGCQSEANNSLKGKTFIMDSMFGTKFLTITKDLEWGLDDKIIKGSKVEIKDNDLILLQNSKPITKAKYIFVDGVLKLDIYESNSKKHNEIQIFIDGSQAQDICMGNYATKEASDFIFKDKKEVDCDHTLSQRIRKFYINKFKTIESNKK